MLYVGWCKVKCRYNGKILQAVHEAPDSLWFYFTKDKKMKGNITSVRSYMETESKLCDLIAPPSSPMIADW